MSWPLIPLGEMSLINPSRPAGLAGSVSFVPMAAVSSDGTIEGSERRSVEGLAGGFSHFQRGDILVAKITPCFENNKIAVADIDTEHGFGSTEFHVIRPNQDHLDARYLFHFLRLDRVKRAGEQRMTGSAGQRRVPRQFLLNLEIPSPPLSEQRRIAAILDKADELRQKQSRTVCILEHASLSAFDSFFGELLRDAKTKTVPLGQLAEIVSGVTKGRILTNQKTRFVPYLAVSNVKDRALDLGLVKQIPATEEEIERYRLKKDDLLLTEGGDPDKLGRGTLWNCEIEECIHQNHIFRVRITSAGLLAIYLSWLVGSTYGKRYFLRSAKQTTGIASINKRQLSEFPVAVPPLSMQHAFARVVQAVEAQKDLQIKHGARLERLWRSLQAGVFDSENFTLDHAPQPIAAE